MFNFFKQDEHVDNRTSYEKILDYMQPNREYTVAQISSLVWYEWGTRLGDLVRKWVVKKVGTQKGLKGQTFVTYSLI